MDDGDVVLVRPPPADATETEDDMTTTTRVASPIREMAGPGATSQEPGESGQDEWVVTFDLAYSGPRDTKPDLQSFTVPLLMALRGHSPLASTKPRGLIVTMSVRGSVETAVPRAVDLLWTALEASHAAEFHITKATQVSHHEVEANRSTTDPLQILCASDCARYLEVSRQRISQLIDAGAFPRPDNMVGNRPVWYLSTIQKLARQRRRLAAPRP